MHFPPLLHVTADPGPLAEEQPLPVALRHTSLLTSVLYLEDHWKSLQSEQAFETVRTSCPTPRELNPALNTFKKAGVLLAISGVFVTTPVSYFDYTSPAPYCLLFISLMLAVIALLTSGLSMIHRVHTDRHWTQEQLKPGSYFVLSYLLSIVTPMFFVALPLHCFIFGELFHHSKLSLAFSSKSMICRVVTAVWMVTYVVNIGTILMVTMWKYAYKPQSR
ncbi:hypothetical protein BDR03DRAFT_955815 [Suillus americanus]|nr:hypothetical protein BDR03DRAFT_955815 [Suillus americanus]